MKDIKDFDADWALNVCMNKDNVSFKFPIIQDIGESAFMSALIATACGLKPGIVVADLMDHFHGFRCLDEEARYCTIVFGPLFIQLGFRAAGLRDTGARVNFCSDVMIKFQEVMYPDIYLVEVPVARFNGSKWIVKRFISLLQH